MQSVTGSGRVVAGRYELLDPVGHGAMGTVWRARDSRLGREVAVKEVRVPGPMTHQDRNILRERSLREARVAARLSHPGVVTVHDVIEAGGTPWIIMELVPSRSLAQVLAQDGPLSPARAAAMGMTLLEALGSAHAAGVVHRDVKPGNILVTSEDRVVLTDFGIATMHGDPGLTQAGMVMGTPGFCAPERIRGEPASPASDLWSLGATLYAAVEGRSPFEGQGSAMAVLANIVHGDPPPAKSAGPLGPVITALMKRDPAARPDADAARLLLAAACIGHATGTDAVTGMAGAPGGAGGRSTLAFPVAAPEGAAALAGRAATADGPAQTATDGPAQTATDGPAQTATDGPAQAATDGPAQAATAREPAANVSVMPPPAGAGLGAAQRTTPMTVPPQFGRSAPAAPTAPTGHPGGPRHPGRHRRALLFGGGGAAVVLAALMLAVGIAHAALLRPVHTPRRAGSSAPASRRNILQPVPVRFRPRLAHKPDGPAGAGRRGHRGDAVPAGHSARTRSG